MVDRGQDIKAYRYRQQQNQVQTQILQFNSRKIGEEELVAKKASDITSNHADTTHEK
ncbi:hypothetical protein RyT2_13620 [Pseudolactococcus yaeyamensis]